MPVFDYNEYHHGTNSLGGLKKIFGSLSTLTLAQRIAAIGTSEKAVLEIYGSETIAASLEIPSNISVIMKPGSSLSITSGIVNFEGPAVCEGVDHFNVSAGAELIFNSHFNASPTGRIFQGAGKISFGRHKTELATPGSGWTLGANWSWDGTSLVHTAGSVATAYQTAMSISSGSRYDVRFNIASTALGNVNKSLGGTSMWPINADAYLRQTVKATNTNPLIFTPADTFAGSLSNISVRAYKPSGISVFYPDWWGVTLDGSVDNSAAINAALLACYYAGGGKVYLRPGIWGIESRIHHPVSGVLLCGSGSGTSIFAMSTFSGSNKGVVGGKYGYAMLGFINHYQGNQTVNVVNELCFNSSDYAGDLSHIWFNTNVNALGLHDIYFLGNEYANHVGIDCPWSYFGIASGTDFKTIGTKHHMVGRRLAFARMQDKTGKGCIYAENSAGIQRWDFQQLSFASGVYHTAINFGGRFSCFSDCYFNNPDDTGNIMLKADGTSGGFLPIVRFTNSGLFNELRNAYWEGDDVVKVLWTGANNGRNIGDTGYIQTGYNTQGVRTEGELAFTDDAATSGITRIDDNSLTISGDCISGNGLGWYLQDGNMARNSIYDVYNGARFDDIGSYIWVENASGIYRIAIDSSYINTKYEGGLTYIKTITTLPAGPFTAVYRQPIGAFHQTANTNEQAYLGFAHPNQLCVGHDYYSGEWMKCLRHFSFNPYSTSHTIANNTSEALAVTKSVSPSLGSASAMSAVVLVALPRAASAGLVATGQLNAKGDTVTLNITNLTGGTIDLNGMTFEIVILGY